MGEQLWDTFAGQKLEFTANGLAAALGEIKTLVSTALDSRWETLAAHLSKEPGKIPPACEKILKTGANVQSFVELRAQY
eukprot:9412610-Alexandrium_andersonii.AAC.1